MAWWQETFRYGKLLITLITKIERNEADIKELQRQVRELTASNQQLAFLRQLDRERAEYERQLAEKDRELLISRLETRLLRHERSLPPPTSSIAEDDTP